MIREEKHVQALDEQDYNLNKVNVNYYRAISLYHVGEYEESKQLFEWVVEKGGKLYHVMQEKEYIEKTNSNK